MPVLNLHASVPALLVSLSLAATARAQDTGPKATTAQDTVRNGEDRVLFDFSNKSLIVYGLHNAKASGRKNGVDAEFGARREGKQVLLDYFESMCKKSDLDSDWIGRVKPKSGWNGTSLTSQGSEIFPEATLLIKLTTTFSDVFSKYPPTKIAPVKNGQGQTFVFRVPSIPGHFMRCGTVQLKLSPSRRIEVAPGYAGGLPEGTSTVHLMLGKSGLEPASSADEEALKRSEIGAGTGDDQQNALVYLPLVTKGE